jgi:putative membrane protein insertion efficiency factor
MVARFLIALIRVYQLTLSRLIRLTMGNVCRFEPSCSQYAAACLAGHGALRGSLLSLKRLCRCHPFHPGGYDPPPPPRNGTRRHASEPAELPDPASPVNPVNKVPILTESAEASAGRGRAP